MSGEIVAIMGDLMAELEGAGIPATMDPDLVLGILAEHRICALVGPPDADPIGISPRFDLDIPVSIACNPPGSFADWEPVLNVLPVAMRICGAGARPVALSLTSATVPAYRIRAPQSIAVE